MSTAQGSRLVVGILVGGRSTRMGGRPKGMLEAPDGSGRTLVRRLIDECQVVLPMTSIVLLGQDEAYRELELPSLKDAVEDSGPMGALVTLLRYARRHKVEYAIALSCDLPYVSSQLLQRLARHLPMAAALSPKVQGRWEPLIARYHIRLLPALEDALQRGHLSVQRFLDEVQADALPLMEREQSQLRDWDEPADVHP